MRIQSISLCWFRGAADLVSLDLGNKSAVIYGANGSGKSSFVDAVEYAINGGKISHLAHEYSGQRQEKAVLNTHLAKGGAANLGIKFAEDSELKIEIQRNGSSTRAGGENAAIDSWDYRRTILRQGEVADFIQETKGRKYSALLPLLGLGPLEVAAENLRQLRKSVDELPQLRETRTKFGIAESKRKEAFGTESDDEIQARIERLHASYCGKNAKATDPLSQCRELKVAIDACIAHSSSETRQHACLQDIAGLDPKGQVDAVRAAATKLAADITPLIAEKLAVLESTSTFVGKLELESEVECPACGRSIPADDLRSHIEAERERLTEAFDAYNAWRDRIGELCDTIKSLQTSLGKEDLKSWREGLAEESLSESLVYVDGFKAEALRASCGEADLLAIEFKIVPLIETARSATKEAPPDAKQLSTDRRTTEAGEAVIAAKEQAAALGRAEALVSFIGSLEQAVRNEIKDRSQNVFGEISADIRDMWAILHPDEAVGNAHLYVPKDADKAIDIGLEFHGVKQDSPRLTLSESYRNSLGLCIFLAMAKREAAKDRPLFLDDVVVSLDRNHRGMVKELLETRFSDRQVIVLTHDRDWYAELRQQLDGKDWEFQVLLPYESPNIGIRWSHSTSTFGDARALLQDRPDAAGNDARKIMDSELASIAERLRIRLPYLRGEKNDRRGAHELLERIVADGQKCFQRKANGTYEVHSDALAALKKSDKLLISWGNRASHSSDLVRAEAAKLIDECDEAIQAFKCSTCGKAVWSADAAGPEHVQCECGAIRWRYGKG